MRMKMVIRVDTIGEEEGSKDIDDTNTDSVASYRIYSNLVSTLI